MAPLDEAAAENGTHEFQKEERVLEQLQTARMCMLYIQRVVHEIYGHECGNGTMLACFGAQHLQMQRQMQKTVPWEH
jgi:hypothetical protein